MLALLSSSMVLVVTAELKNLTVYRVTPKNVTQSVSNLNTGDVAGDTFFSLYEMFFPLYCEQMPHDSSCTSRGSLNIPNNNLYEKSVVEVDTRWGAYSGCTPNASTGVFVCNPYVNTSECWYNMKNPDGMSFTKTLGSICKKSECRCDAVTKNAVGIYNKPMGQWPVFWHNQTIMWEMIETLSSTLDGYWYATRAEGQCKAGQVLGSGECFWKFHGVQRTINATCLQQGLQANVVAQNKACWDKLPDGGKNVSAVPWSECFLSTLTGKAIGQHGTPSPKGAMSREEIVAPFDAAFERPTGKGASNRGRCPDWHPSM